MTDIIAAVWAQGVLMTIGLKLAGGAVGLLVLTAAGVTGAAAKPADCFTTDDGNYRCNFRGTDKAGSFRVTAPGYPAVTLEMDSPGVAWVFKNFGDRNVALPGPYYRASDDRACWDNPDTGDRLCVW